MERQVSTIHINKFVDLPDGSTVQIVASGPLLTFLVIQKQQNGSRVLYADLFVHKKYLKDSKNVADHAGGHDGDAVHGEGVAQEQVLPQCELLPSLQPAADVVFSRTIVKKFYDLRKFVCFSQNPIENKRKTNLIQNAFQTNRFFCSC